MCLSHAGWSPLCREEHKVQLDYTPGTTMMEFPGDLRLACTSFFVQIISVSMYHYLFYEQGRRLSVAAAFLLRL